MSWYHRRWEAGGDGAQRSSATHPDASGMGGILSSVPDGASARVSRRLPEGRRQTAIKAEPEGEPEANPSTGASLDSSCVQLPLAACTSPTSHVIENIGTAPLVPGADRNLDFLCLSPFAFARLYGWVNGILRLVSVSNMHSIYLFSLSHDILTPVRPNHVWIIGHFPIRLAIQ